MALDETLKKAERETRAGDLTKARDRLLGLVSAYPDDLFLRKRLGEVFWLLHDPEKAGRYWYLLPSESPAMDDAKAAFERRHGGWPDDMLHDLRFRGRRELLNGTYAEAVLLRLEHDSKLKSEEVLACLQTAAQRLPQLLRSLEEVFAQPKQLSDTELISIARESFRKGRWVETQQSLASLRERDRVPRSVKKLGDMARARAGESERP